MACNAPATIPPAIVAVSVDNSFATTTDVDNVAVEDNDVDFAAVVIAAAKTLGTAFSCVIVDDDDAILKPRFVVFIAAEEEEEEDDDAKNARRSLCDIERWNAFI
jgi:hypothetical protein